MWLEDHGEDPRGHVVSVHGELAGPTATALCSAVDDAVHDGAPTVIVDLTDSAFLDSTGVATLIACWRVAVWRCNGHTTTALAGGGRRLGLVLAADAHTRRLLQVRGLDHLFAVAASRDQTFSRLGLAG